MPTLNENPFRKGKNKRHISWGKESDFVDSGFVKTCHELVIGPEKDEFSESVAEFMQRNKLKIDLPLICRPKLLGPSLQTPCTEFVAKELRTPEVDLIFSPVTGYSQNSSAENSGDFWRTYSAYTSGYQSVDRLSDIDEFEESFR